MTTNPDGTTTVTAAADVAPLSSLSLNGTIVSAVDLKVSGILDWQSGMLPGQAGGGSLTLRNNSVLPHTVAVSNFKLINAAALDQEGIGLVAFG